MAYYNYKRVRDILPDWIISEQGEDYEGSCDYDGDLWVACLLYTSPSPRDYAASRMPSSA